MKAQARADMTGVSLLLRSHRELGLHTESEEPAIGPALHARRQLTLSPSSSLSCLYVCVASAK